MKDTDGADLLALEHDVCASLWEVLLVFVGLVLSQVEMLILDSADLGHKQAEGAVDRLERRLSVKLHNADFPLVLATGISVGDDFGSVTDFKDLLRDTLVLIRL